MDDGGWDFHQHTCLCEFLFYFLQLHKRQTWRAQTQSFINDSCNVDHAMMANRKGVGQRRETFQGCQMY